MKSISLFTGAGGLDLGLEAAGFEPAICVELDKDPCATLRLNRPHWRLLEPGDIHAHRPEEILEQARLQRREAILLSGGPPCQPFSKAALWVNGKMTGIEDIRSKTLEAYVDVVEAALPQVLLLENVRGISSSGNNGALRMLESRINWINQRYGTKYRWAVLHLNAAAYGVPQTRERTYLLADRDGGIFELPCPTHASPVGSNSLEPYITAWDAIGDLDTDSWDDMLSVRGKWAELLPSIPEGRNYLWHTSRGGGMPLFGWRTRFWSFLLKLAKDRPSWTLPACPGPGIGPFHWRNRSLSPGELCRLQTFPDDYIICGTYSSIRRQIGNAVPPLLGEILGNEIRRQWLDHRNVVELHFLRLRSGHYPAPAPMSLVPKKYWALAGEHKAHQGVGKGPGALKQIRKALTMGGS